VAASAPDVHSPSQRDHVHRRRDGSARSPLCHQAAAAADIASLDSAAHGIAAAARVVAPPVGVHGSPGCGLNLGTDLTREGNRV
jgi:hypothetical protein